MNLPLQPIKESEIFQNFEKHDRNVYPPPVYRVTGGMGGEALLILGSEKTALYDGGMACFADRLIENMETIMESEERTLDYVLLSHTHYDHIGGLPLCFGAMAGGPGLCCGQSEAGLFQRWSQSHHPETWRKRGEVLWNFSYENYNGRTSG